MGALVLTAGPAVDRLAELDLGVDLIERAVRRADAEARMCTPLDPPIMEGLTRWGRTTRFLREELVLDGWEIDNPRNLARTIHPDREFAVVATSGDAATGRADRSPTTRYAKGYATAQAVAVNGQLTLDLDLVGMLWAGPPGNDLLTWFLLSYADDEGLWCELSLPDAIDGSGQISNWHERILLPVFPYDDPPLILPAQDPDPGSEVVVQVNRR